MKEKFENKSKSDGEELDENGLEPETTKSFEGHLAEQGYLDRLEDDLESPNTES